MPNVSTESGGNPGALVEDAHVRAALLVVERLQAGRFEELADRVDPEVPGDGFSASALRRIWSDVATQQGALGSLQPLRSFPARGRHAVDFAAAFQRQELTLRVVVDDEGRLSGLWLLPPPAPPYAPPAYVDAAAFRERDLTVGAEPWLLPGTLALPVGAGPFCGVVLVHGSGPQDRDESIGPNRPFRDLAGGLASRGIAVLRYDKRTRVHGARMSGTEIGVEEEVVADALSALEALRATPGVDPAAVFLFGHSLGAFLAPDVALRADGLAGAILVAAPTRGVSELALQQLRYVAALPDAPAAQLAGIIARVEALRAGGLADDEDLLGAPVRYWREVDAIRPVEGARRIATPLLFVQGGRDYQVPPGELDVWRRELAGRPDTTFLALPALNHLLVAGSGPSTPAEYAVEGHVAPEAIDAIADWIHKHGRR